MYQIPFTGEINKVIIDKNTGVRTVTTQYEPTIETYTFNRISIVSWRDIALKHLPIDADISTAMFELKCEYLHFDYLIPSRVVVPSSAIPVSNDLRDTDLIRQTRAIEFKNKFNRDNNYAFEFRLVEYYDPNYQLGDTFQNENLWLDSLLDYPTSDLIYNNRLPGFIDLIPYIVKNGSIFFGDIKKQLMLEILPVLQNDDIICVTCGYTGSVTYEKKPIELINSKSENVNITTETTKVLNTNNRRYAFYLSNNSSVDIYYHFGINSNNSIKLKLKPGSTLIYENKSLNIDGDEINYPDKRYVNGLPLWLKSSSGNAQVSIEELSF
ncbi:hypothetical protein [Planktothrix sp.]|uniref:hypothetical protein n=1 Tax=Planktothrix sp. TaxID=3088171 RepID=UPI0038D40116